MAHSSPFRRGARHAGAGAASGACSGMAETRAPCVEMMECGEDRLLYRVTMSPEGIPPVPVRALEAALDAARAAAQDESDRRHRSFRFLGADGAVADFDIADRDARLWAAAVDRRAGLQTLGGLSLCLRLLALVDLLSTAPWASRYVAPGRAARIDRHLLRAAARADLTEEARFDEASFCRNLSPAPPGGRAGSGAFTGVSA